MAEETTENSGDEKLKAKQEINVNNIGDLLAQLDDNRTSSDQLLQALLALKGFLKSQQSSLTTDFGQNGLNKLRCILKRISYKTDLDVTRGEKLHLECIYCVKELLNKTAGIQLVIDNKEIIAELCKSMDYTFPSIMTAALDSLSIICFLGDGHKYILQALTEIYEDQKDFHRFSLVIDGLSVNNDALACSCWKFMNAVINSSNNLDLRLHLRNEFMRTGLRDILEDIEKGVLKYRSKEAEMQLNIFHRYREQDSDKIFQRFDNLRFQFDEIDECFELIKTSILGTEGEPMLLSILQHLLCIRDDPKIRLAYYRLIEECVSQIVIHHSGCDPDFRTSRKVAIYVHPEIGQLPQKNDEGEESVARDVYEKIEEIVMAKQALEDKISELKSELRKCQSDGIKPSDEKQITRKVQFQSFAAEPDPQTAASSQTTVENGKPSMAGLKSPDKVLESRPSFLQSIRFRSKSCSGGSAPKIKETEEKARKAKEAAEQAERGRKKREDKKQSMKKIDRVARQAKADQSAAKRSTPPDGAFDGVQTSTTSVSASKALGSSLKAGPVSPPYKSTNEENGKSKPRWH